VTFTFKHPSYYAELRKQNKKPQAPSEENKEIESDNEQAKGSSEDTKPESASAIA
jgi:hypothetical protein